MWTCLYAICHGCLSGRGLPVNRFCHGCPRERGGAAPVPMLLLHYLLDVSIPKCSSNCLQKVPQLTGTSQVCVFQLFSPTSFEGGGMWGVSPSWGYWSLSYCSCPWLGVCALFWYVCLCGPLLGVPLALCTCIFLCQWGRRAAEVWGDIVLLLNSISFFRSFVSPPHFCRLSLFVMACFLASYLLHFFCYYHKHEISLFPPSILLFLNDLMKQLHLTSS